MFLYLLTGALNVLGLNTVYYVLAGDINTLGNPYMLLVLSASTRRTMTAPCGKKKVVSVTITSKQVVRRA